MNKILTILTCLLVVSCSSDADFAANSTPSIPSSADADSTQSQSDANRPIGEAPSSSQDEAKEDESSPNGDGNNEDGNNEDGNATTDPEGSLDYDGDSKNSMKDGEYDGDTGITNNDTGEGCAADDLELSFPPEIEACFKQNRIWDFSRGLCTQISGSCSDNCQYDNLISAINNAGMATPQKIEQAIDSAKLVTWGTKNDGKTIVAQWVYPPSGSSCTYDLQKGLPVTGCYRIVGPDEPKLDKSDPEAVKAFVNACIDE